MKSVVLIFCCLILAEPASAGSPALVSVLAQDGGNDSVPAGTDQPDDDTTVQRGASSSTTSKVTPVTQNFNVQGVIMLFVIAVALFPLCKSSARGH
ncbi:MAG TPA: hypothetical protein VMM56_07835 [Planctomycetaceae bacterium]|nr:hypothetical protein [Planctomycetaceae bacterium]